MEAYIHNDSRIREWINQIVEEIFAVCLLTGVDSDTEFQKGCQIIKKLTSVLQETPTLPSEFLEDGIKRLLDQQLPDARIINSFPAFQATMDRMLREGIFKVTDAHKKEAFNSLASYKESTKEINIQPHDGYTERPMEVSHLKFVTHSVISALAQVDVLTQAEKLASANALVLADALAQSKVQAKADAQALAEVLAQVDALTQAEKQANANALALADSLAQVETQAKADALVLADALAQIDALTQAEKQAKADALAFADAKFEAVTELEPDALFKVPALDTSIHSENSEVFHPSQVPKQANLLKRVLSNIFPKGTVYWNKSLMGQTFLAQVDDILICLDDPEHPCNLKNYNKDGWKVLVCSTEDLTFPRRLERGIRQIQRSVIGGTCCPARVPGTCTERQ